MTFKQLLLANRCKVTVHGIQDSVPAEVLMDDPSWTKLYYGDQPRQAHKHLAKLAKNFPEQAKLFAPGVEEMLASIVVEDAARAQRKAQMQARREARAAKAQQKKDLGVDLKRKGGANATPETYKALRVGLLPIERALAEWLTERYTKEFNALTSKLTEAHWDVTVAFPARDRRTGLLVPDRAEIPMDFYAFFALQSRIAGPKVGVIPADVIAARAARNAADEVASFGAKLAGKVDDVLRELAGAASDAGKVSSVIVTGDMWKDSIVAVSTTAGAQVWHTQVIWNQSVLGKQFNQWPTRRIS